MQTILICYYWLLCIDLDTVSIQAFEVSRQTFGQLPSGHCQIKWASDHRIELGFELEGTTDLVKLKTKIHIIRIYDNLILFETASNCSKEVHDSTLYVIYGD